MLDLVSYLGEDNLLSKLILDKRAYVIRVGEGGTPSRSDSFRSALPFRPTDLAFESFRRSELDDGYWWAEVMVSQCRDTNDVLNIIVKDAHDKPVKSGQLTFLGQKFQVEEGVARCPVSQLKEVGRHSDYSVYLTSKDLHCIHDEGRPTWKLSARLAEELVSR